MSFTLYKYRIWCSTENTFTYIWLDSNQSAPTTCPTNTAHTIDSSSVRIVEKRDPNLVEINQETVSTNQLYRFDTQAFDALPNQTTAYSFSYTEGVSILETHFVSAEENRGDSWSWVVSPDTTVGALTANAGSSDTTFNVSSTVTTNVKPGFYVKLFDGTNTSNEMRVTSVNAVAGTITTTSTPGQSFSAATPTYVRMSIYFIRNAEFGHPWLLTYGEGKIKCSYVPAGTTVRVLYTNNSGTTKRIVCYLELMY